MSPEAASATPYDGLRVVELAGDPAGEMTGAQFAHLGAEVIKVEPPGGAPSRHIGPWVGGIADPDKSLAHWYYNGNKASVVLDLESREGRASVRRPRRWRPTTLGRTPATWMRRR